MNLYQTHNGSVLTHNKITEIGAIADGWKRADQHPRPLSSDIVDVVLRNGIRHENAQTSRFNWRLDGTEGDIVAFRIVPKPNMQLEVGGIYKARNGEVYGPLKAATRSETYNFCDATRSWTPAGEYYRPQPSHDRDLVALIAVVPTDGANEWIAWNKPSKPSLPDDTIVEVVTRSGKVQTGQRVDQWFWVSSPSASQPHPILAYRVVPTPIAIQESAPTLTIEERLARLEARFS